MAQYASSLTGLLCAAAAGVDDDDDMFLVVVVLVLVFVERMLVDTMELLFVVEEDALFVDKDDDEYDAKVRDAVETMTL